MSTYLNNLTDVQKIRWIQNLAILSFIATSIYAPELWINTKEFPTIPLLKSIYTPSSPIDLIICILFFGLMVVQLLFPKKTIGFFITAVYIYMCFVDQNRLQPYFYQSILTVFFINIFPTSGRERTIVFGVSLLFFATYFWSGIHKINGVFFIQWMGALTKHFSFIPSEILKAFTYAVPFLEAALGIALFIKELRKIAILSIVGMHSIIIIMLFYLGYGFNVVPWNIQNILSVLVLFWSYQTTNTLQTFFFNFNYKKTIVIVFTLLLPFSNLFGCWDHLLSFSFFTSKLNYYSIELNDKSLKENLPEHIQKYFRIVDQKTVIYANEWAGDVNRVLFYPEKRCILYLEKYIQSYSDTPEKRGITKLIVYNK
jgi:hypothetical protein